MSSTRALRCRSVARTHVGLIRTRNEDSLVDRPEAGLWAIADGMGGHPAGDRASGLIKEVLEKITSTADIEAYLVTARSCLEAVNEKLRAATDTETSGSTAVVLLTASERFACAWVGDSRLYRLRAGCLERLTRDHNLVEELVASGALTAELAHHHPLAHRITRAVGVADRLELDVTRGVFSPGDRYLLSSDGLHGVVTDAVTAELLALPDLAAAADALIAAALRAGAPDNVTVILVAVEGSS